LLPKTPKPLLLNCQINFKLMSTKMTLQEVTSFLGVKDKTAKVI